MTTTTRTNRRPAIAPLSERLCITPEEAAGLLGISYVKILDLARRGEIPHAKVGKRIVFRKAHLEGWLDRMCAESMEPRVEGAAEFTIEGYTA
jgi:excisionase family DNA binding protein